MSEHRVCTYCGTWGEVNALHNCKVIDPLVPAVERGITPYDSPRFSALSGPDGELIPDLMEGQHAPNPRVDPDRCPMCNEILYYHGHKCTRKPLRQADETDYTRVSEEIEDMRASLNELVLSVAAVEKSIREFVSAYTDAMTAQHDKEIVDTSIGSWLVKGKW